MELFARFTAWLDYLSGILGVAEVDEREAEKALAGQEAAVMLRRERVKGDTVTLAKAERDADPDVQERAEVVEQAYAYRKLLGVLYGNAERDLALVSRELTRRVGGNQSSRTERSARWRA